MQQNKPRGSVMILVVSIIMIIGSAFGLIGSLITGAAGAFVKTAMTDADIQSALAQSGLQVPAGMLSQVLTIITILSVISAIIELICAIIGIVNRNKVEKAGIGQLPDAYDEDAVRKVVVPLVNKIEWDKKN